MSNGLIRIENPDGTTVTFEFTPVLSEFLLAAMRSELVRAWRCKHEDGSYGSPCTYEIHRTHNRAEHHTECGEIVYYKINEQKEQGSN